MNEFLADMYNTRESIGASEGSADDVEKLAEAKILSEELAAEGYDASQLPSETLMKVAYELWGENSALVKSAMEEEKKEEGEEEEAEEEGEKKEGSFEEKVAEADFLGRVMAHSFVNEQAAMDKEASIGQAAKNWGQLAAFGGKKAGGAAAEVGKKAWGAAKKAPGKVGRGLESLGKSTTEAFTGKGSAGRMNPMTAKAIGAGAVGVPLAAGAGLKALTSKERAKEKGASALDALAEARAVELLKEAGYTFEDEESRLKEAVDQRALEMLKEAGYIEG